MSFTISDAFVQQFTTNLRMLAQQQDFRFRNAVIEDTIVGESAYMEQLAPTAARKVIARHSDSPIMNTQHLRRRIAPFDYDWGDLIDRQDKVRLLIDPESGYTQAARYALKRGFDDEIIAAFFGTAYAGHSGSVAITWPNGSSESTPSQPGGTQIAVNDWTYGTGSGNSGLTISKLISAQVALLAGEGDEDEPRYLAYTAQQLGNLLATTEATSADYAAVRALNDGKIDSFMGFKFIHSERLMVDGSGYRRLPAWRKSAIGLGVAQDIEAQASPRPDKRFAMYVYAAMSIGAARLEEVKLVEIKCA